MREMSVCANVKREREVHGGGLIYLEGYYYFWQTRDGKCINRLKLCGFSRDALLGFRLRFG